MREVGRLQRIPLISPCRPDRLGCGLCHGHPFDRRGATAVAEGGTSRPFEEQCRWLLRQPPAPGNVSSIGALGIAKVVPERGGRSSENLAAWGALDELRTPEGQIRRQISSLPAGEALAYRGRLAQRLELLLVAMEEEGEAWSDDLPVFLAEDDALPTEPAVPWVPDSDGDTFGGVPSSVDGRSKTAFRRGIPHKRRSPVCRVQPRPAPS